MRRRCARFFGRDRIAAPQKRRIDKRSRGHGRDPYLAASASPWSSQNDEIPFGFSDRRADGGCSGRLRGASGPSSARGLFWRRLTDWRSCRRNRPGRSPGNSLRREDVANFGAPRIDVMSLAQQSGASSLPVAPDPGSVSLSPDGRFLVVAQWAAFPPQIVAASVGVSGYGYKTYGMISFPWQHHFCLLKDSRVRSQKTRPAAAVTDVL